MQDHDANFRSSQTPGDARDILARLYREIGISAVAAALQATAPKPKDTESQEARQPRRFGGKAA
ncbi:MAG: hypothetical protein P4L68_01915 [Methylovirgula sp.]|jgi:hypothetical protein|nr:hypothetical protein [Methylovirgula sp.]